MPSKSNARDFDPDKKFLQGICKKAASQAEAARLCGISTTTFARRMKDAKLSRELRELAKKGRSLGRKAWDPNIEGSVVKDKRTKKTKTKTNEPSPLLKAAKVLYEKNVLREESFKEGGERKPIRRSGEKMALLDEMNEAKKEQALVPPPKDKQEEEFFGELANKLNHLDRGDTLPSETTSEKIEVRAATKRERCLPLLIRIAEVLLDECNA